MPPVSPEYAIDARGVAAATDAPPDATVPRFLAPHYLALAGVAQIALDHFAPLAVVLHQPWSMLGWLPMLAGIGLQLDAFRRFRARRTPLLPGRPTTALVTGGVYRFTRNPMYLGMVLILIGGVVIGGSVAPALVPPLFVWIINRRLIRGEEARLSRQFGDAYADYRRRVRRWI